MCFFCVFGPENISPRLSGKPTLALIIIRFVLIVLLLACLVISIIYFVISLNALGDDIDRGKEVHLKHAGSSKSIDNRLTEIERENHIFGVTNSYAKDRHITVLIVWTIVTMMTCLFTGAALIGAMALNGCLVLCYAIMTLGLFISGFYLSYLVPHVLVVILMTLTMIVSVLFVIILKFFGIKKHKKNVTFNRVQRKV